MSGRWRRSNETSRKISLNSLFYFRIRHELRSQIPELISHLVTHRVYDAVFEVFYVETTAAFYRAESSELSQKMVAAPKEFFRHVTLRVEEEIQRSKDLLPIGSWAKVREVTEQALLGDRLVWLAEGGE